MKLTTRPNAHNLLNNDPANPRTPAEGINEKLAGATLVNTELVRLIPPRITNMGPMHTGYRLTFDNGVCLFLTGLYALWGDTLENTKDLAALDERTGDPLPNAKPS